MKKAIFFFLSLLFTNLGYSQSLSPEVIASAGDHFTGNNVQLSWTIGELMVETYVDGSTQLTQGFHQTNLTITAVEDLAENIHVKIFPNPTVAILNVDLSEISDPLSLSLYDVEGKQLLEEKALKGAEAKTIDLTSFATGTYFLQLNNQEEKMIKTFKIVKIK